MVSPIEGTWSTEVLGVPINKGGTLILEILLVDSAIVVPEELGVLEGVPVSVLLRVSVETELFVEYLPSGPPKGVSSIPISSCLFAPPSETGVSGRIRGQMFRQLRCWRFILVHGGHRFVGGHGYGTWFHRGIVD